MFFISHKLGISFTSELVTKTFIVMVCSYSDGQSFNHILHKVQIRYVFQDICEFQKHFLILNRLAQYIDNLVHPLLVHILKNLKALYQFLNNLF